MPKIRKIKIEDRKDSRGGGYSRRKFTVDEADAIRKEYNTSTQKITISSLARKYCVSQPLMYQLLQDLLESNFQQYHFEYDDNLFYHLDNQSQ